MSKYFIKIKQASCLWLLLLISCDFKEDEPAYNGYVEAEMIYINAPLAGHIESMDIKKGQLVTPEDILFTQNSSSEKNELSVLKAQLEKLKFIQQDLTDGLRDEEVKVRQANWQAAVLERENIQKQHARLVELNRAGAVSQQRLEDSATKLKVAQKREESYQNQLLIATNSAEATVIKQVQAEEKALLARIEQTQYLLSLKAPRALVDGVVYDIYYQRGEWLPQGAVTMAIMVPDSYRAIFYVPIGQLANIKLGDKVLFSIDGLNRRLHARVNYISSSAEFTPPVIYSEKTRQKMIFQVEAEVEKNTHDLLKNGQLIDVFLAKSSD